MNLTNEYVQHVNMTVKVNCVCFRTRIICNNKHEVVPRKRDITDSLLAVYLTVNIHPMNESFEVQTVKLTNHEER